MNNNDLMQHFIDSGLPAEQITTFKAGAALGYLMAKRQMVEAIDRSLQEVDDTNSIDGDNDFVHSYPLEELRDYVRNVMLFYKG